MLEPGAKLDNKQFTRIKIQLNSTLHGQVIFKQHQRNENERLPGCLFKVVSFLSQYHVQQM